MAAGTKRASHVQVDRPIARQVGARIRLARRAAGLTQAQLAAGRYTKAYVSALENGLAKPSLAALNFLSERLGISVDQLLVDRRSNWTRMEADLRLASGDWQAAADAYSALLGAGPTNPIRAELLAGLAEAFARLDRGEEAVRAASEAAALFRAARRPGDALRATYWQASGLYAMEQGTLAMSLLERILDEVAGGVAVEPDLPVRVLIALASVAGREGEPERALGYLEQARSRIDELDDRKRAVFMFALAVNYRDAGDLEAAMTAGLRSLAHFRASEEATEVARLQNELALVYLAMGNVEAARTNADEARAAFARLGDQRWLAHVTDTESQIALASGAHASAIELAREALVFAQASGDRKAEISATLSLARGQRAEGDLASAALTLEAGAAIADALGRRGQLQHVLAEWSDVTAERGDYNRAYELSRRALSAGRWVDGAAPVASTRPATRAARAAPTDERLPRPRATGR